MRGKMKNPLRNLKSNYTRAKCLSVLLTGVINLLGMSGILSLYSGHALVGSLTVAAYIVLLMFDSTLYMWIQERMWSRQ